MKEVSNKSRLVALLCFFFGGIGTLIDFIKICCGSFINKFDNTITNW